MVACEATASMQEVGWCMLCNKNSMEANVEAVRKGTALLTYDGAGREVVRDNSRFARLDRQNHLKGAEEEEEEEIQ